MELFCQTVTEGEFDQRPKVGVGTNWVMRSANWFPKTFCLYGVCINHIRSKKSNKLITLVCVNLVIKANVDRCS